ncbi:MAG TPA: hypothetical protein VFD58_11585 [Blastocatellia bacterium]|nr:hypothetical protein [Blastocatellia bacterium]
MLSFWEYLAYRRSLSPDAQWALAQTAADEAVSSSVLTLNLSQPDAAETVSAPTTDKLASHGSAVTPPAGITEATTRQLDAPVKGQEEKF